jgi:ribokinase
VNQITINAPLIATFGSINADISSVSDYLPKGGQTVRGSRYSIGLGGKGANQSVAIAALGGRSVFIGRIGADEFGAAVARQLADLGVDTKYLTVEPSSATGIALIMVDRQGENCIVIVGGANSTVNQADVDRALPVLKAARVLQLQLETPLKASLAAAAVVRAAGGFVILDPAPAPEGGLSRETLSAVDLVTPNETETEALIGIRPSEPNQAAEAAKRLIALGASAVVIKMGRFGGYYRNTNCEGFVPAFRVKSVNSVGAGDSFNGGLATALARGDALPEAVRFAAACGALATTGHGAATSAPTLAAVLNLTAASGQPQ